MLAAIENAAKASGLIGPEITEEDQAFAFNERQCWRVLIARSGREQDAADWLKRMHIPVYWPNYPNLRPARGQINGCRRREVWFRPIFPGFLFIADTNAAHWDLADIIERTPGLLGYMRNGRMEAAELSEKDITDIRLIEGRQNMPTTHAGHNFDLGNKVRFRDGLLAHWGKGCIKRLYKDGRISVELFAVLGRAVTVLVLPHQIERSS